MQAEELDGKQIFVDHRGHVFMWPTNGRSSSGLKRRLRRSSDGGEKEMRVEEFPEFLTEPVAVRAEMSVLKAMGGVGQVAAGF